MVYGLDTSLLVAVNGQTRPFPSLIAWDAFYTSLFCSSLTHQRLRRESPCFSQLPPTKPREFAWLLDSRHQMLSKLGKTLPPNHFVSYANVHYFPFAIVTHTQSKPKPPSNQVRFDSGEGNAEGDEDENDDDQDRVKERRRHREDQKPAKVEIPLAKKPVSSVVMAGQRHVFLPMQPTPLATMRTCITLGPNDIFKLGSYCSEKPRARPSIIPCFLVMCHTL